MNKDFYGEILNGEETYKKIAEILTSDGKCLIGWTDQGFDHRDILFVYNPVKAGEGLQRGLRWCNLFVNIMGDCCMGFCLESRTDNIKHPGYIKEKLRLHDNSCDDKICELINGVIHELDLIEGNIKDNEEERYI